MAERDPFGRLPDENPLAGLGSLSDGSGGQEAPQPVAAGWEAFEEVSPAEPEPADRPRSAPRAEAVEAGRRAAAGAAGIDPAHVAAMARRVIRIFRIGVTIVIVVVIGLIALGALASEDDEPGTSREVDPEAIPALPAPPPPASTEGSIERPVGLQPRSLLLRRNVSQAMRQLATSGLGKLRTLRIAPERMDLQLVTREGKLRIVQVRTGGATSTLSLSGSGFGALPTMRFADVDAGAPARLARGAAERSKRPVSRVDYVALVGAGPRATWTVVMRGGGQFIGDARGRITRRIG